MHCVRHTITKKSVELKHFETREILSVIKLSGVNSQFLGKHSMCKKKLASSG